MCGGDIMNTIDAIRGRRSLARLHGEIPEETIAELVELATMAPNHHMTEPWLFTVVTGEARYVLGEEWSKVVASESPTTGEARDALILAAQKLFLRAPVLIVVSVVQTPGNDVQNAEDFAATSAAIQNLLLSAWDLGIGSRWRTGAMAYHPEFRQILGLDANHRIVGIVYLGYRSEDEPLPSAPARSRSVVQWFGGKESSHA